MDFYERLLQLLQSKGLLLADLSRAIGVTTGTLAAWKNGSIPKVDSAIKAAQTLGTTVEYLYTGNEGTLNDEDKECLNLYHSVPDKYKDVCMSILKDLSKLGDIN